MGKKSVFLLIVILFVQYTIPINANTSSGIIIDGGEVQKIEVDSFVSNSYYETEVTTELISSEIDNNIYYQKPPQLSEEEIQNKVSLNEAQSFWGQKENHINILDDMEIDENGSIEYIMKSNGLSGNLSDELLGYNIHFRDSLSEDVFIISIPSENIELVINILFKYLKNDEIKWFEPNSPRHLSLAPNDPLYPVNQDHYAQISIPTAWDYEFGSSTIRVAIVDTGIDYNHEDLQGNYLSIGYDWINGDNFPMDDHGHGTHVAGTVAASTNNGIGVAGIAQVSIFAEKVCNSLGSCPSDAVANGIIHATNNGADIINLSLGGPTPSSLEADAIAYARSQGVIIVAATGNDGLEELHYPAAYDEVISVGAVDADNNLASFSNYGSWIDIVAPGVSIASTYPNNGYVFMDGTSMATPHVTGVIALILSKYPNYTLDDIEKTLYSTTTDLGDTGYDKYYGWGLVNAVDSLRYMQLEDVENGMNGWSTTGLWHLVDTSNPYAEVHSGTHSFWYGQDSDGTYNTGSANSGHLTSPDIKLGNNVGAISFWGWYDTEESDEYDLKTVILSVAGGGAYAASISATKQVWQKYNLDISAIVDENPGKEINLSFFFDTIDSSGNNYRGWFIDDIRLEDRTPEVNSPSDLIVEQFGSTQQIIWTATDSHMDELELWYDNQWVETGDLRLFSSGVIYTVNTVNSQLGIHNYTAMFTDLFGNRQSDTVMVTVVDTTSPIINNPMDLSYEEGNTGNIIDWTVSDTNPDVYNITLDGVLYMSDTVWTTGIISINIDSLSFGNYEFVIYIYDTSGNWISNSIIVTVVDTSAPIINNPVDITYDEGITGNTIEWVVEDFNPDVYNITLDGILHISDTSWSDGSISINIDDLSYGAYEFTINLYDDFGNWISDSVIITVVDTTSPEIDNPVDMTYEEGNIGNTIDWTVSDTNPDVYNITLDGVLYISDTLWTNGIISINIDSLNYGVYEFIIRIYDDSGNWISDSVIITVVDTTSPEVDNPADRTYEEGSSGNTIDWNVGDINPDVYSITIDGALYIGETPWTNGTISINIDGLAYGTYEFRIYVYDDLANWMIDSVILTVIDTTVPEVDNPVDMTYEEGNIGNTIDWTVSDTNPDVYNITLDGVLYISDTLWTNGIISINIDSLNYGVYEFIIRIYDDFGSWVSDTVIITVVDTTSPEVDNPADMTYEEGSSGNTINWTVSDANPDLYNITLDGILHKLDTPWSDGAISISIDGLNFGIYEVIIYIYDTSGNWISDSVIITVIDTTPPEINNPGDITYEESTIGNIIEWTVGDINPDVYNITLDGILFKSDTDWTDGTILINIDGLSYGDYGFIIYVYDDLGNWVSDSVIVMVIETISPELDYPLNVIYEEGSSGHTIEWTVGDENPDEYNITLNGTLYKSNTSWSNGTIFVTIDGLAYGTYEFIIYVYDDFGNWVSDTVIVTVVDTTSPEVNNPVDITYEEGSGGNVVEWTIGDLNSNVYYITLDGNAFLSNIPWSNGVISINIDSLSYGDYEFLIIIYDDYGNWVSDTVIVTVVDTTEPEISNPDDVVYEEGATGNTIEWAVGDLNPDVYSITLDGVLYRSDITWLESTISINIDGLIYGTYEFVVYLYDTSGNWISNLVMVSVVDTFAPIIDNPSDMIYEEGSVGNNIEWTVGDTNPGVYNITLDGILHISDTLWTDGVISINIDGLSYGVYELIIYIYDTSGNWISDSVSLTVIDTTPPVVNNPLDMTYGEGSTGNIIEWILGDINPDMYNITLDGILHISDTLWTEDTISINIDGLSYGSYEFIIYIYDTSGNWISDSVSVTVFDTTTPDVNNPSDIIYDEGSVGNIIEWILGDSNPGVYNITLDGILFKSDTLWTNGSIAINIDGLSYGTYVFTIHNYDTYGNWNSDSVIVSVVLVSDTNQDDSTSNSDINSLDESSVTSTSSESETGPNNQIMFVMSIMALMAFCIPLFRKRKKLII